MSETPLLAVDGLTVRFGGLVAVDAVSFAVQRGEIVSLIGPNGAGKTTVFNAITLVHPATGGAVRVRGRVLARPATRLARLGIGATAIAAGLAAQIAPDVERLWERTVGPVKPDGSGGLFAWGQPFAWGDAAARALEHLAAFGPWPLLLGAGVGGAAAWRVWSSLRRTPDLVHRRGIARTFQNIRLFAGMTCIENVQVAQDTAHRYGPLAAVLRLPRWRGAEQASRTAALELLAFVGLRDAADLPAGGLPYGHQRRLEIARALAGRPDLLLLDEPAAGMNPSERVALMELIRAIRARGTTVLLIEHDMGLVMGISDRVVVLDYGKRIAEGAPAQVRADPRVIEAYLGTDTSTEPAP